MKKLSFLFALLSSVGAYTAAANPVQVQPAISAEIAIAPNAMLVDNFVIIPTVEVTNEIGINYISAFPSTYIPISDTAISPLSARIVIDPFAPSSQIPDIVTQDVVNNLWDYDIIATKNADIVVQPNITPNVNLSSFYEFGMEGWTSPIYTGDYIPGHLNIHNPYGAQLVIFEVTGPYSSFIGNTNINMTGYMADFILSNPNGALIMNSALNNFNSFTVSGWTSEQILMNYMIPTLYWPSFGPFYSAAIKPSDMGYDISLDIKGNLKGSIF